MVQNSCLRFFLVSFFWVSVWGFATTDKWPSWRGLNHDGVAEAENLPTTFSSKENLLWRKALPGPGPSTPVIWDDWIFLSTADGEKNLRMIALNLKGEEQWSIAVGSENYSIRQGESNAAAPSPVTDGKLVWFLFGTGELVCLDTLGKEVWSQNLVEAYGKFNMYHGYASSPLLREGRLYLQMLHSDGQLVVALDAATGVELWKHNRQSDAKVESLHSYSSPIPLEVGADACLIIHGSDYVTGHSFSDGREVWRQGHLQNPEKYNDYYRLVATPVVGPGGLLVVPSAKNGPVLGLRPLGGKGLLDDQKKFHVWRMPDGTPDVPSPLIVEGLVYLCRENGILICLEADTGNEMYKERLHPGNHRASPLFADNKIYIAAGDGTVSVVKPGKTFEVLAKNALDERIAASPVVANNTLFIRTYSALYAFSLKK